MPITNKPLLALVLLAFGAYSLWAMLQVGYLGIWQGGFGSIGATQITLDLIVSCLLVLGFIARDCRSAGRAVWPWVLAVLVLGSIGALAYLLWPHKRAAALQAA